MQDERQIYKCKYCGSEIEIGYNICPQCRKTQNKKYPKIIGGIIIGILAIYIIYYLFDIKRLVDTLMDKSIYSDSTITETPKLENPEFNQAIIDNYKNEAKTFDYKDIYRYAEDYEGQTARFNGKVIQVVENNIYGITTYELRVNVTKNSYDYYEDTIYVLYTPMKGSDRILEDDIITIYGKLNGLKSYTSIIGTEITIPYLISDYIEIK